MQEPAGRILALDLGKRRIGLALSDELRLTAQGIETLVRTNLREDLGRLASLAAGQGVTLIVIGNPRHMDGREGAQSAWVREFAAKLESRSALPSGYGMSGSRRWKRRGCFAKAGSAARSAGRPSTGWPRSSCWRVTWVRSPLPTKTRALTNETVAVVSRF